MRSLLEDTKWEHNDVLGLGEEVEPEEVHIIPHGIMCRGDLSAKAKLVFAYMTGKPRSYQFAAKRMASDFKESYRAIRAAILELEEFGYLQRKKLPDGRMLYSLRENYWSLTQDEGKEVLLETFTDAYRRVVTRYDRVTYREAVETLRGIVGELEAPNEALEFMGACSEAEISADTNTLEKWCGHLRRV